MKYILCILGIATIIGGVLWHSKVEVSLTNWQLWVSWIVIWIGVHFYGEYRRRDG